MSIKKYINRVERFDQLVRAQRTGPPHQIAEKLGLSESAFYAFVEELKEDYGFPIAYSRTRKTYFYTEEGRMVDLSFQKIKIN